MTFIVHAPVHAAVADVTAFNVTQVSAPTTHDQIEYTFEMSWTQQSDRKGSYAIVFVDNGTPSSIHSGSYYTYPGPGTVSSSLGTAPHSEGIAKYYQIYVAVTNAMGTVVYADDNQIDSDWY